MIINERLADQWGLSVWTAEKKKQTQRVIKYN